MTITRSIESHVTQAQPIQSQASSPAMPTYLTITPYPVSSLPTLSIADLTDRIDTGVQGYLSPTVLSSLSPSHHLPTHDLLNSSTPSPALDLQPLAAAYGETCSLIWQQALSLSPPLRSTSLPSACLSSTPLTRALQTLTHHWATGKYRHPNAPFFRDAITLGSLQAKWQYPAIQSSLRRTTANLRQRSPYTQWLAAYPTCWSYAVGRTMHQLLQWNYRLTPAMLREFLMLD